MSLLLPQPRASRPRARPPQPGPTGTAAGDTNCSTSVAPSARFRGLGAFTVCARCHATSPCWEASAGKGSLYSWTVVWRPPDPTFQVPYAPAVVRLDEGFWMLSAVIGCEPEALHEGLRLAVEFHPASDEITLPYFRPGSEPAPTSAVASLSSVGPCLRMVRAL